MSDNGIEQKPKTFLSELAGVLSDHIDLVSLEAGYESQQAARRLAAIVVAACLLFGAFVLLQVAILFGLARLGIGVGWASLGLAVLYGLIGTGIAARWGRRDPKVGSPFEGTRREVKESLQWIQKLFS